MTEVEFSSLKTAATEWRPEECEATLFCQLDGRIVPTQSNADGARMDSASLVVLDNFIGQPELQGLLGSLTDVSNPNTSPSADKWERNTADDASASMTWGLRAVVLQQLAENPTEAMIEVQSRLAKLYPDYIIANMPSAYMQGPAAGDETQEVGEDSGQKVNNLSPSATPSAKDEGKGIHKQSQEQSQGQAADAGSPAISARQSGDCCNLLANAPVHGDHYNYHVDADPLTFPESEWRDAFGDYCNREPGYPLLVSLLLYLVGDDWDRDWHAETLFLDTQTEIGIVVRPKKFRAVLMDQDIMHRVVQPSVRAEGPRYSLVWKLAFLPKQPEQACTLAKPDWGPPTRIGSAARMESARRAVHQSLSKRKR